jgi:hypothetical protein
MKAQEQKKPDLKTRQAAAGHCALLARGTMAALDFIYRAWRAKWVDCFIEAF